MGGLAAVGTLPARGRRRIGIGRGSRWRFRQRLRIELPPVAAGEPVDGAPDFPIRAILRPEAAGQTLRAGRRRANAIAVILTRRTIRIVLAIGRERGIFVTDQMLIGSAGGRIDHAPLERFVVHLASPAGGIKALGLIGAQKLRRFANRRHEARPGDRMMDFTKARTVSGRIANGAITRIVVLIRRPISTARRDNNTNGSR